MPRPSSYPRVPMWIVRGNEIIRVRDVPGQPPAPVVEGRITRGAP